MTGQPFEDVRNHFAQFVGLIRKGHYRLEHIVPDTGYDPQYVKSLGSFPLMLEFMWCNALVGAIRSIILLYDWPDASMTDDDRFAQIVDRVRHTYFDLRVLREAGFSEAFLRQVFEHEISWHPGAPEPFLELGGQCVLLNVIDAVHEGMLLHPYGKETVVLREVRFSEFLNRLEIFAALCAKIREGV